VVAGLAPAGHAWFWQSAVAIALVLLLGNVAVLVAVYVHVVVQSAHRRRDARLRAQLEPLLEERDLEQVRLAVERFGRPARQVAAALLIERLADASDDERARLVATVRAVGGIELLIRGTHRRLTWRRALAIRTLGRLGVPEAVPVLLDGLGDHSRYVRESAVLALGRTGDRRALPVLGELLRTPGSVGGGVVYDALIAFGRDAEPVFAGGLRADAETARIAACFGVAATSEPDDARRLVEPLLADPSPYVRAAAAESIGQIGGSVVPEGLARALRDDEPTVRAAAVRALGSFDSARAVQLLLNALVDPDRDTVVRAGDALVRLTTLPEAGSAAARAIASSDAWPVQRARIVAAAVEG
jgi:HEAT repeat protein